MDLEDKHSGLQRQDATAEEGILSGSIPERQRELTHSPSPVQRQESYELATSSDGVGALESKQPLEDYDLEAQDGRTEVPHGILKKSQESDHGGLPDDGLVYPEVEVKEGGTKLVSLWTLFRYSTALDRLMVVIGVLLSLVAGVALPIHMLLFGDVINQFVFYTQAQPLIPLAEFVQVQRNLTCDVVIDNIFRPGFINSTMNMGGTMTNMTSPGNALLCNTSPDLVFSIFDYVCDSGSTLRHELGLYSAYYVALATGVLIASFIATLFLNVSAYRQGRRIRLAFYRAILKQDIGWFDVIDSAQLSTRLADDIDKVEAGIGDKIGVFVQYLATFISGYVVAFTISWKMTLVVGSLLPIMAFLACAIALLVASFALRESAAYASAGAVAEEVIAAIRTVVAFGGEKKEVKRYGNELGKAWAEGIKKAYAISVIVGILYLVIFGAYALGFWYGSTLIIDCEIVAGDVSTVLFTVLIASFALGSALPELQTFATALGSATSIFQVIDRQPLIDSSSEEGEKPAKLEGNIEFSDVVFHYPARPDVQILNGLDLKIKRGQTVALVGPSGCGKSTTMQLIQRFYNPAAGLITVDGIDIKSLNVRWLRNQIGIVSQEPILFNATIGENIRYGKEDATMADVEKAARNSNIHDFISELPDGYDTPVGERGAQLSGGQKQRIAIARALVTDPKILLLDEATSALDTESEKTVQVALDKAKEGRTTIVIAHRLSTIQTADLIVALDKGRVVEMGTHDELLATEGLYYDLVTAQTIAEDEDKSEEPLAEFKSAVRQTSMKRQETILEQEGRLEPPSLASLAYTRPSISLGRPSVSSQGRPSVSSQGRPSLTPPSSLSRSLAPPKPLRKLMSRVTLEDIPLAAHPTPFPGREGFPTLSAEPRTVEEGPDEDTATEISWVDLIKLNKDDWLLVIIGVVTSAMIGVLFPCISILFAEMLETFSDNDRDAIEDRVVVLVGAFIALAVGAAVIYFLSNLTLEYAGENLTKRLRYSTFKAMLRQNIGWFDERAHSTGALTTRLAVDVSEVKGATGLRLSVLLQALASFVTALVISFIATWELSLLMMVVFPLLGGFSYLQLRFIITQSEKNKKRMEESGQIAVESIENIRTVAGLGVEEKTFLRYSKKLEGPFRTNIEGTGYQALVFAVAQSITFYTYAVGISVGAALVIEGRASFNDVFQVFGAMIFTAQTVGRAFSFAPDASKGKVSAARILALIKKTPPIDSESEEGITPDSAVGNITAGNLQFHYPTRPEVKILQGLTVSVKPGQTLALVGPSGCGKSTIISLIERFYDPLEGVLKVDGHDVKDYNLHWLRSQIGLVGQEPILFDASIGDNIRYGANFREVSDEEVEQAAKSANIHNFISSLPQGYDTNVGSKGAQLSGGQKQRIAIARAMVRDPKILLLDEATSALDTESERIVQEALDKAREGRTTITIAHRLSTIYTSDCIAVIHKGQVIESGTHSQLMDLRGAYYHLNTVQLQDDE